VEKVISPTLAYLLGLITGRGHIFYTSKILVIEFSHSNKFIYGVAHCDKCGDLVTKVNGYLKCKKCGLRLDPSNRSVYNQPEQTIKSLKTVIIPFLQQEIEVSYSITGNRSMTLLVLDFKKNEILFNEIQSFFNNATSFDSFHIPVKIYSSTEEAKIEFINGLLDTAGFPSSGGWLNRPGKNLYGRMRVYFQIVRNWHLPVEIDNFLRKEFSLPIHTIDWGHPNIRDGNLQDYFNNRPTSWSREHQIKFFPEYYTMFKFRISSKQALFQELIDHNKRAGFDNKNDWFPPKPIPLSKIKSYHPGEADVRIPQSARRHFNAFWQINAVMGCTYLKELISKAKNAEYFFLTGRDENGDVNFIKKQFDIQSKKLEKAIFNKHTSQSKIKSLPTITPMKTLGIKESQLYEPLSQQLKKYLISKYHEPIETFDVSSNNLNFFLKNKNIKLFKIFDYCDKFRIRPDIVGFLIDSKRIVFEEVKIVQLDLKSLGQLLGYCFVAQPEEAILVSSQKLSLSLIKVLKARPDLLQYSKNKKIQLATWRNNRFNLIEI